MLTTNFSIGSQATTKMGIVAVASLAAFTHTPEIGAIFSQSIEARRYRAARLLNS
jgi:hypothetical protein